VPLALFFANFPNSLFFWSDNMPGKAAKIQVTKRHFEILDEIVAVLLHKNEEIGDSLDSIPRKPAFGEKIR
jgi:hypothetical protein